MNPHSHHVKVAILISKIVLVKAVAKIQSKIPVVKVQKVLLLLSILEISMKKFKNKCYKKRKRKKNIN